MQKIFNNLKQVFICLGLILVITLAFVQQPSYATTKLTPEEKLDRAYQYNEAAGLREEKREDAYEQAVKDAESPQTMEKAYERNLKAEKAENPDPSLIEKAKDLVKDVTSK